jgi:heme-degrading monooxygenase HmoA
VLHQLRVYEIFDGNKAAFHDRFRDHAARIMERHGFRILAAWETSNGKRTEFVYLLEWPDAQAMAEGWKRLAADGEWTEIKRQTAAVHGPLVGDIDERVLRAVPYSPNRVG